MKKYIRVLPYINKKKILSILKNDSTKNYNFPNNYYFFNSWRAALKFILLELKNNSNKKKLTVWLQDFTCSVVADAIIESWLDIKLIDINLNYYSNDINQLLKIINKVDIFIISHLFGIPNPDYVNICNELRKRNIIIIDDLAQTVWAKINWKEIWKLSDFAIHSYWFDKPLSTLHWWLLINNYSEINTESNSKQQLDLATLLLRYEYWISQYNKSDSNYTVSKINLTKFINEAINNKIIFKNYKIKNSYILKIIKYIYIKFLYKLKIKKTQYRPSIEIYKMWCIKKGYIYSLLNDYNKYKNFRVENSKLIIDIINNKKLNATYPKIPSNIDVAYNRFPILSKSITENKKLLMLLKNKNIEAGNYNWQSTIWDYLKFYNLIDYKSDDFPNSNFAKKNIINLPIWSNKIWNNF